MGNDFFIAANLVKGSICGLSINTNTIEYSSTLFFEYCTNTSKTRKEIKNFNWDENQFVKSKCDSMDITAINAFESSFWNVKRNANGDNTISCGRFGPKNSSTQKTYFVSHIFKIFFELPRKNLKNKLINSF